MWDGGAIFSAIWIYAEGDLSVFHRVRVLRENLLHYPVELGLDLVHDFHRFDDAEDLTFADSFANGEIRFRPGLGRAVIGPDHRRLHFQELRFLLGLWSFYRCPGRVARRSRGGSGR